MAANDTTATLTAEIKTTYDKLMLDRAIPQLIHTQLGQKRTLPVGGGRSIEFRRLNKKTVSTTALVEGTTPTVTSLSITTVTATVNQYGAVVTGSDWLETMAIDPILAETSEMLGEDAGDTLDQVCRDILVAGTNVRYASTAVSRGGVASGMVLTATEIRKAVRGLKSANARPFSNNKFGCLLHPNAEYDVFADTTIQNNFQYAGKRDESNPLFAGELGAWQGVTFIESSNAKIFSSLGQSGQDVYATLFMGADAYGVTEADGQSLETYFMPKGSGGATGDPLGQIWSLGWKATFSAVILNQNWLTRLEHSVTP